MAYYVSTLLVFFASYVILGLGLNIQYGLAGVLNFGYYLFFAIGAYIGGITAIGGDKSTIPREFGESYAWGLSVHLPYPITVVAAMLVAALFSFVVGTLLRRSVREDFSALITFVIFLAMYTLVGAYTPLFNGYVGISGVPSPVSSPQLWYTVIALSWAVVAIVIAVAITHSPFGRVLRAIRERPDAAAALGKNVNRYRLSAFVVGNALAALSGAVLIAFIGAWSPQSWQEAETIVVFAIVIVGGTANNLGVVVGAALVGVAINEAVVFLPTVPNNPTLVPSLQWVIIGAVIVAFLWFRPKGLLPERPARFKKTLFDARALRSGLGTVVDDRTLVSEINDR